MSDVHAEARINEERMQTELLRQEAAKEELEYWKRRRQIFEADLFERLALKDLERTRANKT